MVEFMGVQFDSRTLSPKVRRVLLLYCCGFPLVDCLVADLRNSQRSEVLRRLRMQFEAGPCGIVIRTVTQEDGKGQPSYWVRNKSEFDDAVERIRYARYVTSFVPPTDPECASGYAVGRLSVFRDGSSVIEYCASAIRPRVLEKIACTVPEGGAYGRIRTRMGNISSMTSHEHRIYTALSRYRGAIRTLLNAIQKDEICLEFVHDGATVEFYDYDV